MGHGITDRDGMVSVRQTPWHGLGVVLPEAPADAREAFHLAGIDWEPVKMPVFVQSPDGSYKAVEGAAAICRDDTYDALGIRTDEYGTITHKQVEGILDGFCSQPTVNIETLGSLWGGRVGWALLSAGDGIAVPGDDSLVKGYLLASWSHDGTKRFTIRDTRVRVVCHNTLTAAHGSSAASFTVKHTKGASGRVNAYAERVEALAADLAAFGEMAAALSAAPFTKADWRTAADALYPLPVGDDGKVKDGITTERALNAQDAFLALRGGATVAGPMADSAWGAYNAATEMADWLLGVEVNPDKRNLDPQSTFLRTIGGGRDDAKATALSVVAGIAGVSIA